MHASLGTTFWATLQFYTGKHYSPDLGNLTFIKWESRQANPQRKPRAGLNVCEDSPQRKR
jgi:hypothetical protein